MSINGAQNCWINGINITGNCLSGNVGCNINCYRNNVGCYIDEGNIYIVGDAKIGDKPVKGVYAVGTDWNTFVKILQEKGELKDVVIEKGQIVTDPKKKEEIIANAKKQMEQATQISQKTIEQCAQSMQQMAQEMQKMQQQSPFFYTLPEFQKLAHAFRDMTINYVRMLKGEKVEEPKKEEKKEEKKKEEPKKDDAGKKKADDKDAKIKELEKKIEELSAKLEEKKPADQKKDEPKKDKPKQNVEITTEPVPEKPALEEHTDDKQPAETVEDKDNKNPSVQQPVAPASETVQDVKEKTTEKQMAKDLIKQGEKLLSNNPSGPINDTAKDSKNVINAVEGASQPLK